MKGGLIQREMVEHEGVGAEIIRECGSSAKGTMAVVRDHASG